MFVLMYGAGTASRLPARAPTRGCRWGKQSEVEGVKVKEVEGMNQTFQFRGGRWVEGAKWDSGLANHVRHSNKEAPAKRALELEKGMRDGWKRHVHHVAWTQWLYGNGPW